VIRWQNLVLDPAITTAYLYSINSCFPFNDDENTHIHKDERLLYLTMSLGCIKFINPSALFVSLLNWALFQRRFEMNNQDDQNQKNKNQGGQDRTGQNQGGQDRTGQNQGGQDRTGQNQGGQDKTGQNQGGHDRTGQNQGGQDRTGQNQGGQDKTGQNQRR